MKLEQQVTSLELSKKLKELGVKQGSLFLWAEWNDGQTKSFSPVTLQECLDNKHCYAIANAFTVAELGEVLPELVYQKNNSSFELCCRKLAGLKEWEVSYQKWELSKDDYHRFLHHGGEAVRIYADTEADARAKCLIYLIEQGLMTMEGK